METKEIIANNKLIAEFMGSVCTMVDHTKGNEKYCKEQGLEKWLIPTWSKPEGFKDKWGWGKYQLGHWEYHVDWNWLMPVIEKIESLGFVTKIKTSPTISKKWTIHHMIVQKDSIKDIKYVEIYSEYTENESKISLVYRGVIAFIKWYNENK